MFPKRYPRTIEADVQVRNRDTCSSNSPYEIRPHVDCTRHIAPFLAPKLELPNAVRRQLRFSEKVRGVVPEVGPVEMSPLHYDRILEGVRPQGESCRHRNVEALPYLEHDFKIVRVEPL